MRHDVSKRQPYAIVEADRVCTVITKGTTPPSSEIASEGQVPFLRVNNLTIGGARGTRGDLIFVSRKAHEKSLARSKVYPGDTLMNIVGPPLGKITKVDRTYSEYNINQAILIYRPDSSKVDDDYLYYYLSHSETQKWFDLRAKKTSGQKNLTIEICKQLPVALPDLDEQRRIAALLRTWDETIEKLEALRAAKQKRHRTLTHSLVFGTRQLKGFLSASEANDYRWFSLPSSWCVEPVGKLAHEISERSAEADAHEVLSCSKHDGFVRSLEYFKKQVFSSDLTGYKKIWRGDFGFPSNHVEEGSIGLQNLVDVGVVSPIYTVFRFNPERVNVDYAFAVLKTELYRHIFEVNTSASVDRRGSLRWSEFSKLPFPLPPLAEQVAVAEVLRTAKAELDGLAYEIKLLNQQKCGLMQKLLTGEWRVNVGRH
jgi:type I restriction enzyme S subunit